MINPLSDLVPNSFGNHEQNKSKIIVSCDGGIVIFGFAPVFGCFGGGQLLRDVSIS